MCMMNKATQTFFSRRIAHYNRLWLGRFFLAHVIYLIHQSPLLITKLSVLLVIVCISRATSQLYGPPK